VPTAEVPPDSRRLLLCLNNCRFTSRQVVPAIRAALKDVDQLNMDKPVREALGRQPLILLLKTF
jgi:hypothetical protein